jgi:hypothetical protein
MEEKIISIRESQVIVSTSNELLINRCVEAEMQCAKEANIIASRLLHLAVDWLDQLD